MKKILVHTGIAGLIIWALLHTGYSVYKNYQHNKVKEHFAKVIEYANAAQFDEALQELHTIASIPESTPEEKALAQLLAKTLAELQKTQNTQPLLDSLNSIVEQSNLLEKNMVDEAKKQGKSKRLKKLDQEKSRILKELDDLKKINTKNMTPAQRSAYEAKKLSLLNELNSVLRQIQETSNIPQKQVAIPNTTQDLNSAIQQFKKLNQTNEQKLNKKQKQKLQVQKKQLIEQMQNAIKSDPNKKDKQKIIQQLSRQVSKEKSNILQKTRNIIKNKENQLLTQLENLDQISALEKQADLEKQKQADLEKQKQADLEKQKQADLEKQKQADLEKQKQADLEKQKQADLEKQKQADLEKQKQQTKIIHDLLEKGRTAFGNQDYNTALQNFQKALSLDSKNTDAAALSALALQRMGKPEATAALAQAQTLDPNNPYVAITKAESVGDNNTEQTNALYQQSLTHGDYALALFQLGTDALKNKQIDAALNYFNKAINAPDFNMLDIKNKLYHNTGVAYGMKKMLPDAKKAYTQALKIDPDYTPSHISLGQILYREKNYYPASVHLAQAIKSDKNNITAITLLGNALHMQKDSQGAFLMFTKANQLKPQNYLILYNLGSEEIALGKYNTAVDHLQESLSLKDSNNTKIQLGIALVRSKQNFSKALDLFQQALSQNPNDTSAMKGIVEVYDAQGKNQQALDQLDKVLVATPNDTEALYKQGVLTFKMKKYSDAINTFKQLINIDNSAENNFQLANTLFANNNIKEALTIYETLIKKKETPDYLEGRANCFIKLNKLADAKKDLEIIVAQYPKYGSIFRVSQKIKTINQLLPK